MRPGLEARLARPVFYEVVDLGEEVPREGETRLAVWSGGTFFDLGFADELKFEMIGRKRSVSRQSQRSAAEALCLLVEMMQDLFPQA